MPTIPHIRFYDGREAPCLGLGVWQVADDEVAGVVGQALEMGYRSIDTAAIYDNETGVGRAIASADLPREELFITTKVWNTDHGHDAARAACMSSLEKLGLDYVDLYLIHWPVPKTDLYVPTWETLIQLRDEGLAKSIGVCNFNRDHLEHLLDATGVMPVLNQIELHPLFQQPELRSFHAENGILTQAWSPLGQGHLLEHPALLGLAAKHARSVAQVILRWHLQLGNMVIPKSVSRERQAENMAVFDFELPEDDMQTIAALHSTDGRMGPDPQRFRLPHG